MIDDTLLSALKQVKYPGFSRDIVSFGLVSGATIEGSRAVVALAVQVVLCQSCGYTV